MATTVTLQLNDIESAEAVKDLFEGLTKEDKIDIITKLIIQWFDIPSQTEKDLYGKPKLDEMMKERNYGSGPRYKSEEQAKSTYEYTQYANGLKNLKLDIGEQVFKELREAAENAVSTFVENNEKCEAIIDAISIELISNIDKFFLKAMMNQFASGIGAEIHNVMNNGSLDYALSDKISSILEDKGM